MTATKVRITNGIVALRISGCLSAVGLTSSNDGGSVAMTDCNSQCCNVRRSITETAIMLRLKVFSEVQNLCMLRSSKKKVERRRHQCGYEQQ